MWLAKRGNHHDTVSVLTQVVGEGVVSDGMCGGSDGAGSGRVIAQIVYACHDGEHVPMHACL